MPSAVRFLAGALAASRGRDDCLAASCCVAVRALCICHAKEVWADGNARLGLHEAHVAAVDGDRGCLGAASSVVEGVVRAVGVASKQAKTLGASLEEACTLCFDPTVDALRAALEVARRDYGADPRNATFRRVSDALGFADVAANFASGPMASISRPRSGPCSASATSRP